MTSAVREIPAGWRHIPSAVDRRLDRRAAAGARRAPHARHLRSDPEAHRRAAITVHCTVTRQQVHRAGYIEEFLRFWSARAGGREDLDQPVHAAESARSPPNGCSPADRERVVAGSAGPAPALSEAGDARKGCIEVVRDPPASPDECVFARTTTTHFRGSDDEDHAVPVRRRARIARTAAASRRQDSPPSPGIESVRVHPGRPMFTGSIKIGEHGCGGCARPSRPPSAIIFDP